MDSDMNMTTATGARALMKACQENFKAIVERDGYLWPVAMVIARKNPVNGLIFQKPVAIPAQPDTFDDETKDAYFRSVRRFAAEMDSPGVIFACSAVDEDIIGTDQQALARAPGISSKIYVLLEHVTGTEVWEAPVAIDPDGRRLVGQYQEVSKAKAFSKSRSLLPPQAWLN